MKKRINYSFYLSRNSNLILEHDEFNIRLLPEKYGRPFNHFGFYPYVLQYKSREPLKTIAYKIDSFNLVEKPKLKSFQKQEIDHGFAISQANSEYEKSLINIVNALTLANFHHGDGKLYWYKNQKTGKTEQGYNHFYPDETYNVDKELKISENFKFIQPKICTLISGEEITVIDVINKYLISNKTKIKKKYLNATISLNKALNCREVDESAFFLMAINSIEALMEIEYENMKKEHCNTCGQMKYKISSRFKEFLRKYGGLKNDDLQKILYGLRSKITHSGSLLSDSYSHNFFVQDQKDFDLKFNSARQWVTIQNLEELLKRVFGSFAYFNL